MNIRPDLINVKRDASRMFVYFSQLMDKPVFDSNGELSGEIYDIVVKPSEVYPQSAALIIRRGFANKKYALTAWENIASLNELDVHLKIAKDKLIFQEKHDNREELTLRRDILDQQVVDTFNHKVIRINDIHLLFVDHSVMAAHVDISVRGLLRRLGFEKIADFFVALLNRNAPYLKEEHLISWKYIQPLTLNPASMTIKVDVPQKQFSAIPSADLGEIFLDVNTKHQIALFRALDVTTRARIFTNVNFKTQKLLVEELPDQEVVELLNSIPSDEATDFLEKLPKKEVEQFLAVMGNKYAKKLSELLGYSSDSAGGLMTTEYIVFNKDTTIESVLAQIRERTFKVEPAQFVYAIDEAGHFIGTTNFRRLILAQPTETLEKVIFPKSYFVHLNSSVKEVAYLMEKYKYFTIPVVDDGNVLQGIITVDDILSQLIAFAWRRLKRIKILPKQ